MQYSRAVSPSHCVSPEICGECEMTDWRDGHRPGSAEHRVPQRVGLIQHDSHRRCPTKPSSRLHFTELISMGWTLGRTASQPSLSGFPVHGLASSKVRDGSTTAHSSQSGHRYWKCGR
ncbi:hypothetical protein DPEC_G00113980 [Dallia pectoralis]|uniref:Uncharacterized protein n=1 Tax=Dallia pectoralis TaxID=75939 RepID=A0ACC2GU36_DALPE|nr:hypothetical protein DPEC_G00113980 [Dallia pectoralis]